MLCKLFYALMYRNQVMHSQVQIGNMALCGSYTILIY